MVSYPDVYNIDLLDRIPLAARTVLDTGCGTAALAAAYRLRNPRARCLGIDMDPAVAELARSRLDELAIADVEQAPMPFDVPEGIDCLIYGDILEHLRDPLQALRRQMEALAPDGTVLICIPNVEHWSFTERLLRGTWDYEPSGLLDATHLRWFSLESMRKSLVEAGLSLCDVHPRVFDGDQARLFVSAMTPSLAALGIDPESYARRALPLQFIWRARKQPQQRIVVSANMLPPVGGVSDVRVVQPVAAMRTDPVVSASVTSSVPAPQPGDETPRIFVLHRPVLNGAQGRGMIQAFLNAGWLVVTEFDDHPDFFQIMQDPEQLTFRGVHAVQTSTPELAAVLRQRNPEVAIFPNAIANLPEPRNFTDPEHLTVFFGALNREQDWEPLIPAINAATAKLGDRLRFSVVHDDSFFQALQTPHKEFLPTCDYPTYLERLGRCEISLMPLADNGFNRAKSDLKFIEAGAARVAPLASTVVYGNSIEEGRTGLLFRDAEELHGMLLRLATMPALARDLGEAARNYVAQERMLAYQVAPRIAWYRSLWARRQALTAALQARLAASQPELARAG
jgi:SAM-dependent methyltransferase